MIEAQFPAVHADLLESLDDIQAAALSLLMNAGRPTSPRGMGTLEVVAAGFGLRNPRKRCVTVPTRRWSLPLAIGEFCWHASGSDDVGALEFYSKRWRDFADQEAKIRGSCYGRTLFRPTNAASSQWEAIIDLLRTDPDSRRAVATLSSPISSTHIGAKDIACATSVQFMIRDHKLNAVVSMRSNDVIWGLPYDVFLFTMLQELLAITLGLDLGVYYHFVSSLHLYDRHVGLAERIVADRADPDFEMPPMRRPADLPSFLLAEKNIRRAPHGCVSHELDRYWQHLLDVLVWFANRERADAPAHAFTTVTIGSPYNRLLESMAPER